MHLHDPLADAEPQAGALAGGMGPVRGEETVEDLLPILLGHEGVERLRVLGEGVKIGTGPHAVAIGLHAADDEPRAADERAQRLRRLIDAARGVFERRKQHRADKDSIVDDLEFEMELVKQVEVGIDYILALVAQYHEGNCQDKEIRADIDRALNASPTLHDKRDLIMAFIDTMNVGGSEVKAAWTKHVAESRDAELARIIGGGSENETAMAHAKAMRERAEKR